MDSPESFSPKRVTDHMRCVVRGVYVIARAHAGIYREIKLLITRPMLRCNKFHLRRKRERLDITDS